MPVAMKSKHLIERYDSPTSIQPHGPYSANTYNPAGGAKFTPKLSPGILGSPTVSMVSPEERRQVPVWSEGGYPAGKNPAKNYMAKPKWHDGSNLW